MAIAAIATALHNGYRLAGNDYVLEGQEDTLDDHPADRIRFFTISREKVRVGVPEGDLRECEFGLTRDEKLPLPFLARRTDPTRNGPEDVGGVVQPVATGVTSLAFDYFDGEAWQSEWKMSQKLWPVAIRIGLTVADAKNPSITWAASEIVSFPYMPKPQDGAAAAKGATESSASDANGASSSGKSANPATAPVAGNSRGGTP